MNRLQAELQRLYLSHDSQRDAPGAGDTAFASSERRVRAMMLELARPAGWDDLAKVWRGVQADLQLPAPSIAVSGIDGFQLWFSLSESVPLAQAIAFLEALRTRYLVDIAHDRIALKPFVDSAATQNALHDLLPPVERSAGQWSAFVAPDLARLFGGEPWLDVSPGVDAQADLLSRLDSMKPEAMNRALKLLRPIDAPESTQTQHRLVEEPGPEAGEIRAPSAATANGLNPRLFLLGIMNDPTIELHLRIEAAKALLPYFEGQHPH